VNTLPGANTRSGAVPCNRRDCPLFGNCAACHTFRIATTRLLTVLCVTGTLDKRCLSKGAKLEKVMAFNTHQLCDTVLGFVLLGGADENIAHTCVSLHPAQNTGVHRLNTGVRRLTQPHLRA
jgi:hypothetical protein